MKDVARAFAEWRLVNPAAAGWPLEAFEAGWNAREKQRGVDGQALNAGVWNDDKPRHCDGQEAHRANCVYWRNGGHGCTCDIQETKCT